MHCVELYFSILIGNFIDQLEEQLIDAVKQCTVIVWPSSLESTEIKEKEEGDKLHDQNNLREFKNLDLTDLSLFS